MMDVAGGRRKAVAVVLLAGLALLAWKMIDPGRVRWVVLIILGGFALRILLTRGLSSDAQQDLSHASQQDSHGEGDTR